jgi:hypothetical protein
MNNDSSGQGRDTGAEITFEQIMAKTFPSLI